MKTATGTPSTQSCDTHNVGAVISPQFQLHPRRMSFQRTQRLSGRANVETLERFILSVHSQTQSGSKTRLFSVSSEISVRTSDQQRQTGRYSVSAGLADSAKCPSRVNPPLAMLN